MSGHQCCERIYRAYQIRTLQCPNKAKVERDGKFYCGTHDPVARTLKQRQRDKAMNDHWARQRNYQEQQAAERALERAALVAIRQIAEGHADPKNLALAVLATEKVDS